MNTNTNTLAPGGRPRPARRQVPPPANRPTNRRGANANRALGLSANAVRVSTPTPVTAPKPEKKIRIYKPEEFVDRETVEVALVEHLSRAQEEAQLERKSVAFAYINGSTYIGFTGTDSRILSHEELVEFVLADKSIAAQLCVALAVTPIPLTIAISLHLNNTFSTSNRLQAPTTAECEATTKEDLQKIVSAFHFKKLPNEVRRMIYLCSDVFSLGHDGQIPPFFHVPLCDNFLREEAETAYKKANFYLTLANEAAFNKMKVHKVQPINHIYFQWGDLGMDQYKNTFLQLRANRCQMFNNFRTLTMDFSNPDTEPGNFALMKNISRASTGVTRLTVRLQSFAQLESKRSRHFHDEGDAPWHRLSLIHTANEWIRTPGRLVTVNTADAMEEWFWERDDGKYLDLGPVGKARPKEAPVKGNMTLEDRIKGRALLLEK